MFLESKITHPDKALFKAGVLGVANKLAISPDWLMGVMWIESRLKASARNPNSSASGLIQFMRDTALELGTTIEAIRAMNAVQQLPYVEKYFRQKFAAHGRPKGVQDLYLLTLYPVAFGKRDTFVIFRTGSEGYLANKGIKDTNPADGGKTVADVKRFITEQLSPFTGFTDINWGDGWEVAKKASLGLGTMALLFFFGDIALRGENSLGATWYQKLQT